MNVLICMVCKGIINDDEYYVDDASNCLHKECYRSFEKLTK